MTRIRELRKQRDISVEKLAEVLDISIPYLYDIEKGRRRLHEDLIGKLCNYLNVSSDYLLGRNGNGATHLKESPAIYGFNKVAVPVYGIIRAGDPIFADQDVIDYEYLPKDLVGEGEKYFCLRVKGDSMKNARIADGDTVLVRKQPIVDNGTVAVVLVNEEEATVKRFYQQDGQIILKPENEEYMPQVYDNKDVRILGEVVKAIINVGR